MPSKKPHFQLYADECFPVSTVKFLKSKGISVINAYGRNLEGKSDSTHLKESKKLNRVLITLDRDFLYYEQVNLRDHPGVIVVSIGSATPPNINKVCEKFLKNVKGDFIQDSLVKVTTNKIVKLKEGKVVYEKRI